MTSADTQRPKRPRTKPPEERRDDLMNAAQRMFIEHGVNHTTVDQITNAAKVAKGTFYIYFNSKEDIHAALASRFVEDYVRKVRAEINNESEDDFAGRLAAWVGASVDGYLNDPPLVDMLFHKHPQIPNGNLTSKIVSPLEELLSSGQQSGAWSIRSPRFVAVYLYSALHGVIDDLIFSSNPITKRKLINEIEMLSWRVVGLAA
ncbi:TetR/AcrR family transcriptional regulator [Limoniibacter endophyticus]|nr:TetR/AcrR family transcriptional regulator [Limoniibacter endophyticus]